MSDLRERFHHLGRDVAGLPAPPPDELRRGVERRRDTRRWLAGAAAVAVVLSALAANRLGGSEDPAGLVIAPAPSTTATASGPDSPSATPMQPWLGDPWVMESSKTSTWPAGQPGTYAFCGLRPYTPHTPMTVEEQRMVHPTGLRALLMKVSGEEGASQIFKWSYAECLVPGGAEGVGGPRNLWSYGSIAAGAQYVGPAPVTVEATLDSTFWLVELTGTSAQGPPTRPEVEALLDAWAGTGR